MPHPSQIQKTHLRCLTDFFSWLYYRSVSKPIWTLILISKGTKSAKPAASQGYAVNKALDADVARVAKEHTPTPKKQDAEVKEGLRAPPKDAPRSVAGGCVSVGTYDSSKFKFAIPSATPAPDAYNAPRAMK